MTDTLTAAPSTFPRLSDWSAADTLYLREAWARGDATGMIAIALGRSPSGICGKVKRLGLKPRRSTPNGWANTNLTNALRTGAAPAPKSMPLRPEPPTPQWAVQFLQIPDTGCHRPYGTKPYMFCGLPVRAEDEPYCAACAKVLYKPQAPAGGQKYPLYPAAPRP